MVLLQIRLTLKHDTIYGPVTMYLPIIPYLVFPGLKVRCVVFSFGSIQAPTQPYRLSLGR